MQILSLSNGKRVANFSSPHPFTFTDGSVLPAVSNELAKLLEVDFHEEDQFGNGDVSLSFSLSGLVKERVEMWDREFQEGNGDVVFVPLPMLTALREYGINIRVSPFRAIRIEDRINKLVSINKQCI